MKTYLLDLVQGSWGVFHQRLWGQTFPQNVLLSYNFGGNFDPKSLVKRTLKANTVTYNRHSHTRNDAYMTVNYSTLFPACYVKSFPARDNVIGSLLPCLISNT